MSRARTAGAGLDPRTDRELRRMAVLYRRALLVAVSRAQPPRPASATSTRTGVVREDPRVGVRSATSADAGVMAKELPAG